MSSDRRRVLITGMGAVTPIGVGVPAYVASLRTGRSGIHLLSGEEGTHKSTVAAMCRGFDPASVCTEADRRRLPRLVPMALSACLEAMADAGLPTGQALPPETARRIGLVLGTGGGGIDFTLDQAEAAHAGRTPSLWSITNATHGNLAGELSIRLGLRGPSMCVSTGCASSSDALGLATDLLLSDRQGAPDALLVVGADAHVRHETLLGMELLRVITMRDWRERPDEAHTACRPFDRTRDGFVLGEGAWAVLLERPEFASARERPGLAAVRGYSATCDAYHRVRPDPDAGESARAMREAVRSAGLAMEEVELVHYHGTATRLNDEQETHAVKLAFGDHARRLRGTSVKSMIGHPQGACGLAAVVATIGALAARDEAPGAGDVESASARGSSDTAGPFVPPTINLREPDPVCDLDYTPLTAVPTQARIALVNCLAFGAKNSAVVLESLR